MTTEIGHASLGIIPSFDGFERNLSSGTSGAMTAAGKTGGTTFGNAAGKSAGARFGSVFKTAAKAGLVGLGALGVGAFALAKDSISAASDLSESTNKVKQVFGDAADSVFKFSEGTADALGQTNQQARDAAATFGIFGKAAELSDKKNAKFSKRMTTLASDLASFHNTSPEDAVTALTSALRGEAEPMRAYGVLLDDAALKAEALRLGLLKPVKDSAKIKSYQIAVIEKQRELTKAIKEHGDASFEAEKAEASLGASRELLQKATEGTIPPLTQQQKVLAASSAIFKQTEVAQGDFARTSDGLANQQRRLSARFEDAKAKLGTGLLPIMTDAADFVLDKGIPAFEDFSDWFTRKGVPALKDFIDDAKPLVKSTIPAVKDGLDTIKDVAEDVAPILKGMFDGFNNLPDGLKKAIVIGAGSGLLAKKFGLLGGGSGPGGIVSGLASKAVPIRTFETNPLALGGGGGGAGGVTGAAGRASEGGKTGALRTAGRIIVPIAVVDGIYEVLLDDSYGLTKDSQGRAPQTPQQQAMVPFGAGLERPDLGDTKEEVDALVDSTNRFNGALDLVGAKKVNPSLRIPEIMQEQDRLNSFGDKLDLVGSKKIRPGVGVTGIPKARADLKDLLDDMTAVASFDFTGITGLAAAGVAASRDLHRNRRRNVGGMP